MGNNSSLSARLVRFISSTEFYGCSRVVIKDKPLRWWPYRRPWVKSVLGGTTKLTEVPQVTEERLYQLRPVNDGERVYGGSGNEDEDSDV